jgi:hypothetical protein
MAAAARAQSESEAVTPQAAQATQPAENPQWLRVTAERVNLRSRADLNSRIVGRTNRDDVLQARGTENGWHKIVPPDGVFSIVATQYIERVGDDRGTVNVETSLRVRVGSDIQARDPMLSEVQTRLERGAEVKILGELDGGWLKIAPPEAICVYISSDYVEPITPEDARQLQAAKAAAAPPDTAEPTQPTTQPAQPPDPGEAWGPRLAQLVRRIETEQGKPADQQDWDAIRAELQAIADQRDDPQAASFANARLEAITRNIEHRAAAPKPPEVATRTEVKPEQRPRFDARGVLRPCFTLPAGPYGLRYKLVDSVTRKAVAYVEFPTELGIDVPARVGKYVGVRGERQTLEDPKVPILRVTRLTVLDPDQPIEPPAREEP